MKRTRKQPDKKVKRKRKNTEEPLEFDMIGILLSNYGMTGENLKIFLLLKNISFGLGLNFWLVRPSGNIVKKNYFMGAT